MKIPKLILTAFLAALAGTASAQDKISLGAQVGASMISLRGNEIIQKFHEPALGYSAGLTFQYDFTENIALHTGISYDKKGSLVKGTAYDVNGNVTGEFRETTYFNYLSVPLLVRATFGEKIKYFVNAGMYAGYLTGITNVDHNSNDLFLAPANRVDFKDLDFGATAGLGVIFPVTEKISLSAEIRDNLGLANISKVKVINDGTVKTNAANLLVGMNWRI